MLNEHLAEHCEHSCILRIGHLFHLRQTADSVKEVFKESRLNYCSGKIIPQLLSSIVNYHMVKMCAFNFYGYD